MGAGAAVGAAGASGEGDAPHVRFFYKSKMPLPWEGTVEEVGEKLRNDLRRLCTKSTEDNACRLRELSAEDQVSKVLIERADDPLLPLSVSGDHGVGGALRNFRDPHHVMSVAPKGLDGHARNVFVGEESGHGLGVFR